jgi:hypothetical protein
MTKMASTTRAEKGEEGRDACADERHVVITDHINFITELDDRQPSRSRGQIGIRGLPLQSTLSGGTHFGASQPQ